MIFMRTTSCTSVTIQGFLHTKPMFNAEISVYLSDILNEKACIQSLLTNQIEHADLGQ